jgi:hypothetical protein
MKFSLFVLFTLFLSSAYSQDFEIIETTSQKWAGGRARSGHGVNYKFTIVCKKKLKKLSFDKLWVENESLELKIVKNNSKKVVFAKNDTIFLAARKKVKTNEYGDAIKEDKKTEKPPIVFETEGLISYQVKRSNKHLLIPKFKKLKAVYYP